MTATAAGSAAWPHWVWVALRTDHAGETGAVWIYRGILAASRDPEVVAFARAHLATESRHLHEIAAILPPARRSRLVGLWRVLGFVTGFAPALVGRRAVFATIAAVETFVDAHYQQQIDRLRREGVDAALAAALDAWRGDEVAHRDDAARRVHAAPPLWIDGWTRLVQAGSAFAVAVARRV
ncbi:MAG: demethoxyubiquinone hydroxylase family protein [Hyphomonadaceae bacterium]|nr:demethoxyubiquinone hydroxylase family protein [Hyphomonadaceae bacterium]